jgi:hypothetical protein
MASFQRPLIEEGKHIDTRPLISSEELYLNLGAKPASADDISIIPSILLNNHFESHINGISPLEKMSEPESEIIVKLEGVEMGSDDSSSVFDIPEKPT